MSSKEKKVLIIDDDASLRIILRKILETNGLKVEEASGVRAGIEAIQRAVPDLVILDLSMPEHDGFIFLKFRSQNSLMKNIPILVVSGSSEKSIVACALAMGADQYLEKPLNAVQVQRKVRQLFYSREHYTYRFPEHALPTLKVELNAQIVAQSENSLKVESAVLLEVGKPLTILAESLTGAGIPVIVGRVSDVPVELKDQQFRQVVTIAGMSQEQKERFEAWRKSE